MPQIYWTYELRSPAINGLIPQSVVLRDIYIRALEEALSQVMYEAKVAGLSLDIGEAEEGIQLRFSGYHDKAPLLLEKVVLEMSLPKITEERFSLIVSRLKREYRNFQWDSPVRQARELFEEAVYLPYVTMKQKESALKGVTFEKFQKFLKRIWTKNYVEGIMLGNLTRQEALASWKMLQKGLGLLAYPLDKQKKREVITLPTKKAPCAIRRKSRTPGSALFLALQDSDFTMKKRGAQQILQQTLGNEFFAELRTRQQTGYRVNFLGEELERKLFDNFVIQSATHTPEELLWRVEGFIEGFLQSLDDKIPQERFNKGKAALRAKLTEKPKSMADLGDLMQNLMLKFDGDFNWIQKRVEALDALTYEEFLDITRNILSRSNRRRLAVLLQGGSPQPFQYYDQKSSRPFSRKGAN